jgi:hypothetical protein
MKFNSEFKQHPSDLTVNAIASLTRSTPTEAEMEYFRGGVSQTDYIRNK